MADLVVMRELPQAECINIMFNIINTANPKKCGMTQMEKSLK